MNSRGLQLLNDMGVDVWFERAPAAEVTSARGLDPPEASPTTTVGPTGAISETAVANEITPTSTATTTPDTEASAGQPTEAFEIVGLALPGALLFCEGFKRREELLFATDILRAVKRSWHAKPKQVPFRWPQVDVSGEPQSALHAFVEKLVADFDCAVLLVTESVMRRMQSCPVEPIVIADLATLTQPEDKRKLWRQLLTIET